MRARINRVLEGEDRKEAAKTAKNLEKVIAPRALAIDTENISKGVFSPLQGFMNQEELKNVLNEKRLPNDLPWTISIVLDVSEERAKKLGEGDDLALCVQNKPIAHACMRCHEHSILSVAELIPVKQQKYFTMQKLGRTRSTISCPRVDRD